MKIAFVGPDTNREFNELRHNNRHLNLTHIKNINQLKGVQFDVYILGYGWQDMCFQVIERVMSEIKRIENEKSKQGTTEGGQKD